MKSIDLMQTINPRKPQWRIVGLVLITFWLAPIAHTASWMDIYNFPQNSSPLCALVQDNYGALYGTTQRGGDQGYGSVFRLSNSGDFMNLVSFTYLNGAYPYTGLLQARDGVLYGTAQNGSTNDYGSVFRVTTNGQMTTLVAFTFTNGAYPKGTLLEADDGALYGTTYEGGSYGAGTVFRVTTNGELQTLVSFAVTNGAHPIAGLMRGADGALFGTTLDGGINPTNYLLNYGSVFRITTNGEMTNLALLNGYGMAHPYGGLVLGDDGLLYGTAEGCVFSITTNGSIKVIAGFDQDSGLYPSAAMMQYFDGAFYGTATQGGSAQGGTIFRVTTNGLLSSLILFNSLGGSWPQGGLLRGIDGALYGTTSQAGRYGGGTVFRAEIASSIFLYPLVKSTNGWNLAFNGLPGDTYRLLRATNLSGPWVTTTNVTAGQFGDGHCVDSFPPSGSAYYRLAFP